MVPFHLWQLEGITSPCCLLIASHSLLPSVSMVKDAMESIYILVITDIHKHVKRLSETVSLHREGVFVEGSINTNGGEADGMTEYIKTCPGYFARDLWPLNSSPNIKSIIEYRVQSMARSTFRSPVPPLKYSSPTLESYRRELYYFFEAISFVFFSKCLDWSTWVISIKAVEGIGMLPWQLSRLIYNAYIMAVCWLW